MSFHGDPEETRQWEEERRERERQEEERRRREEEDRRRQEEDRRRQEEKRRKQNSYDDGDDYDWGLNGGDYGGSSFGGSYSSNSYSPSSKTWGFYEDPDKTFKILARVIIFFIWFYLINNIVGKAINIPFCLGVLLWACWTNFDFAIYDEEKYWIFGLIKIVFNAFFIWVAWTEKDVAPEVLIKDRIMTIAPIVVYWITGFSYDTIKDKKFKIKINNKTDKKEEDKTTSPKKELTSETKQVNKANEQRQINKISEQNQANNTSEQNQANKQSEQKQTNKTNIKSTFKKNTNS